MKQLSSQPRISLKTNKEIQEMKVACQMAADSLLLVGEKIASGITGKDIEAIIKEDTEKKGAICAPFGYKGNNNIPFPGYCCISPNNVICHGIPTEKPLDNSIFNIDITTIYNGAHGDTSAMFFIGNVSDENIKLMKTCQECLNLAIKEIKHNVRSGNIGAVIQEHAEKNGFSVVREYGGHGIGIGIDGFHMPPFISHFGSKGAGIKLPAGLTHTIEPMLNIGKKETILDDTDKWTVRTLDGSSSAQWEHTILITNEGCEVLTKRQGLLKNSIELLCQSPTLT